MGVPVIDLTPLRTGADPRAVSDAIGRACRDAGFFTVVGHGVDPELLPRLERLAREFFAQDEATKLKLHMRHGGRAWRGFFPVGEELTRGVPDQKEGLYFGSELGPDHPKVAAGERLFGANLFPTIPGFREAVLETLDALTELGQLVLSGIALSLDLDGDYFRARYTRDPLILFRIFHYPPLETDELWSVAEHTDYGLLTLLHQDDAGGLQVRSGGEWIEAPPLPDSFVCNIGDMLDRITGGVYRSTPHRVRNASGRGRVSCPFFLDPGVDAVVEPIRSPVCEDAAERWDQTSIHTFQGTYGDYVLAKVSQVFPELWAELGTQSP